MRWRQEKAGQGKEGWEGLDLGLQGIRKAATLNRPESS